MNKKQNPHRFQRRDSLKLTAVAVVMTRGVLVALPGTLPARADRDPQARNDPGRRRL